MLELLIEHRRSASMFAEAAAQELRAQLSRLSPLARVEPSVVWWRVKTAEAMALKLQHKGQHANEFRSIINDFIGFRVLSEHSGKLAAFEHAIDRWADSLELVKFEHEETFQHPRQGVYRAIHLNYVFSDASRFALPAVATVEVQLTTWLDRLVSALSHDLLYKARSVDPGLAKLMQELASRIDVADAELAPLLTNIERLLATRETS